MLQQGNLYTHISHCPGVNKNLVRGVILAVYFLNAYAVLVCTECNSNSPDLVYFLLLKTTK